MSTPRKTTNAKKSSSRKPAKRATKKKEEESVPPYMVSEASYKHQAKAGRTSSRRNRAGSIERTDRYENIDSGLTPFRSSNSGSNFEVREAVKLCQKAYYNFAIFRNAIDLMTEFSVSKIYFKGGSKKSVEFFEALLKKINIWDLQDKFFREYFRSGNVFLYRLDASLPKEEAEKIVQTFANLSGDVKIPYRYMILNPADIQLTGSVTFSTDVKKYHKVLTDYELERVRNPKSEEDKRIRESLPPEVKKLLNRRDGTVMNSIYIPLDGEKVSVCFYKKQDYEPFAVPMGYPVLEDINYKYELKKMDMAIARTVQQAVLLVTTGTDPDKGGVNQKNLIELQKLFENESVGRVLIADYTTEAKFVIPQIGDLLDPRKYSVVNANIQAGLNSMITGASRGGSTASGDKSSSFQMKVEIFLARLNQARQSFLTEFLIPEIKKTAQSLGFKNYPTPYFDEISLRENTTKYRVYSRLVELGILTPEEGIEAIDTGRLPSKEDSVRSQKDFQELKNQGLYQPLIGGSNQSGPSTESQGRPEGTTEIQQEVPRESKSREGFSFNKVKENILLSQDLEKKVEAQLRKVNKVKRLNASQKEVASGIACIIMHNETPENWNKSVASYCKAPVDTNQEMVDDISGICIEHQVSSFMGGILYHSKKEEE